MIERKRYRAKHSPENDKRVMQWLALQAGYWRGRAWTDLRLMEQTRNMSEIIDLTNRYLRNDGKAKET